MRRFNEHHVCYTGATWDANPSTRKIRANQWLKVPITLETHAEIHRQVATVPVLDHYTADRVLRDFHPVRGDYLATISDLMFCIDEAIKHPKSRIIERGIGELAIAAFEIQIPLIKEGMIENK